MMMPIQDNSAGSDGEIDIGLIAVTLWQAKYKLVSAAAVAGIVVLGVMQFVDDKYRATAQVLIEQKETVFTQPTNPNSTNIERSILDQAGVRSQVELLTSADLVRRVLARSDRENSASTSKSPSFLSGLFSFGGADKSPQQSAYERLTKFVGGLDVYQVEGSRVITVEYSSTNPEKSAQITNMVVSEYLALQSEAKEKATRESVGWLETEIARMRETVALSEGRVAEYRAEAGLQVGQGNTPLNREQLTSLNSELARARSVQLDAVAKAEQIDSLLQGGGSLDTSREVINSQLIQRLREQKAQLRARMAQLSSSLLPGHPTIKAIKSQIADLNKEIRLEASNIKSALQNDAAIAKRRVEALEKKLGQLQVISAGADNQSVKLRELEREAKSDRDLLETFLRRYRESLARQNAEAFLPDARIITNATVPTKPYFPRVELFVIAAVVTTLILGVLGLTLKLLLSGKAIAYNTVARGYEPSANPDVSSAPDSDMGLRASFADDTREDVSQSHDLPDNQDESDARDNERVDTPGSSERNSGGRISATLHRIRPDIVSIAPSVSEESSGDVVIFLQLSDSSGSLSRAMDLAQDLVKQNRQAVLIDADLSDIGVAGDLEGFFDVLKGQAQLDDVIVPDADTGLDMISAGIRSVAWDVSAAHSEDVLAKLIKRYDYTIINLGGPEHLDAGLSVIGKGADVIVVPDEELSQSDEMDLREALGEFECRDITFAAIKQAYRKMDMPAE